MKTKVLKLRPATRTVKKTTDIFPASDLAARWIEVKEKEKAIKAEVEELKAEIRARMTDGEYKTKLGLFFLQKKRSLSWSIESLKALFGDAWELYAKANDTLLSQIARSSADNADKIAAAATVEITDAFQFAKAKA